MDYDEKSQKFMEIYSNLPIKSRKEIVAVINKETFSWQIAKREIENKTKMGEQILKKLIELKIV